MESIASNNNHPVEVSIIVSLYRCSEFLDGFFSYAEKIHGKEIIEFLLLHNAPIEEELQIIYNRIADKPYYRHIIVTERENLYQTWNRGINLALGKYLAIWNVDDIRLPGSILDQKAALDEHSEAGISIGDIWGTRKYGENQDEFYFHPLFKDAQPEYMERHLIGCFPMWRKNIKGEIFYFEEQFRLVSDLDFQIRVVQKATVEKVENPTGYYLDGAWAVHKLSSNYKLQTIEHNVLSLRYANYHFLNLVYLLPALLNYRLFYIKKGEEWTPVSCFIKSYRKYRLKRLPLLFVSIIKYPKDLARFCYYLVKRK